jgi:hypothetical protein
MCAPPLRVVQISPCNQEMAVGCRLVSISRNRRRCRRPFREVMRRRRRSWRRATSASHTIRCRVFRLPAWSSKSFSKLIGWCPGFAAAFASSGDFFTIRKAWRAAATRSCRHPARAMAGRQRWRRSGCHPGVGRTCLRWWSCPDLLVRHHGFCWFKSTAANCRVSG